MGMTKWTRLTLDRFGSNLRLLRERDEDDLPVEEDPIGEFLSLKGRGGHPPEAEGGTVVENLVVEDPVAEEVGDDSTDAEAAEPVVVNLLEDPEEQTDFVEELPAGEDDVLTIDGESEGEEVVNMEDGGFSPEYESEPEAGAVIVADQQPEVSQVEMTEDLAATASSEGEAEIAQDGQEQSGGESGEDAEVDSLMDVFRNEAVSDSPISLLSQDLEETDVYSLLEEMKWIANRVKEAPTESE
jgi:hypothetical protein